MKTLKLSVVIVNYNVRFFLEQCIRSVEKASEGIPSEIFVVDNNSVDGSASLVTEQFPKVILIANPQNVGFSKANNQAIKSAKGEYILILNPDTVVQEDTFRKIVKYMDEHPDTGSLGVKMIDGKGHFLPESKRSLPTPWISFYKIFGLSSLFPKSKRFGRYHLSYLPVDQINEVDVLPGAFMLLRKTVIDQTGAFDEDFFMYGEDIDLSYRIQLAGFKNIYFPETAIIHYKGESTKKGSINYVVVFYQAMLIFATKHFTRKNARLFSFFIKLAIYLRATVSLFSRFVTKAIVPLIDAGLIYMAYLIINPWWEAYKFPDGGGHPPEFLQLFVPAYILIWLLTIFFTGGYDRPIKLKKVVTGILYGTALILVFYSLLPESYRFSRALILFGTAFAMVVLPSIRLLMNWIGWPVKMENRTKKKLIIVGSQEEGKRVLELVKKSGRSFQFIGYVDPGCDQEKKDQYFGNITQLNEITRIHKINEIIFCSKDLPAREIIRHMLALTQEQVQYKIAPEAGEAIIGSNSIHTAGDLYVIPLNSVGEPGNLRLKRLNDLVVAILLLALSPLLIWWFIPHPGRFIKNVLQVLVGSRSWVGFGKVTDTTTGHLPKIRKGILTPVGIEENVDFPPEAWLRSNLDYARDYRVWKDYQILINHFRDLNR